MGKALSLGVAGMGGFATSIANLILEDGSKTEPAVTLAAVCDPDPAGHDGRDQALRDQGVTIYDTYEALLAHPGLEAIWLPVPIDLHRPFTEQALAAGLPVMVEKPVAGAIDDVDAMIAARDKAGLPVAVGFHDIYDAGTLPLKRRILAGELGSIEHATMMACWPRNDAYFGRSGWAGRLKRNEVWVLDSPANNALAHYINVALFLLGPSEQASASPVHVEAELYRAAAIENYDTISMRLTLESGAMFTVMFTHACESTRHPRLDIVGDKGHVLWTIDGPLAEQRREQGDEVVQSDYGSRRRMLDRFAKLVRGIDDPETAVATLETARCHTLAINGASAATPVRTVPESVVENKTGKGGTTRVIPGIEAAFEDCAKKRLLLHESGRFDFTQPAGSLDLRGFDHFAGPCMTDDEPASARA